MRPVSCTWAKENNLERALNNKTIDFISQRCDEEKWFSERSIGQIVTNKWNFQQKMQIAIKIRQGRSAFCSTKLDRFVTEKKTWL